MKTVRLTPKQLRKIVNETVAKHSGKPVMSEAFARTLRRLDELYDGSSVGSYLKQAIKTLWDADNFVQRAMKEVETNEEQKLLAALHSAIENLAFNVDGKVQGILSGDVNKQKAKRPLPKPKKEGALKEGNAPVPCPQCGNSCKPKGKSGDGFGKSYHCEVCDYGWET